MTYQNISYSNLLSAWEDATERADRQEAYAYELAEKYDSLSCILGQLCYGKNLLARDPEPGAIHELIANMGEDELAALLLKLPTDPSRC